MRETTWPRHVLVLFLVCCFLATTSGCGCGGDPVARRMAKGRRSPDNEDASPAKAVQPGAAQGGAPVQAAPGQPAPGQPAPGQPAPGAGQPSTAQAPTQTATPSELPSGGPASIVISPIDRSKPLSLSERREQTILRLKKIGLAIGESTLARKQYPAPASFNRDRYPLLSWRVHLLPYLGHDDLYEMFKLNEPWNSAHNKQLLAKIPPVYQSPDRPGDKTNYLLVVGPGTIFAGIDGAKLSEVTDGLANTALLVEVNNENAVPWTQPVDYNYSPEQDPRLGLNQLRDDGFFVVWANSSVRRIPPDVPGPSLRPMFTKGANDPFTAASIDKEAVADVDPKFAGRVKPTVAVADVPAENPGVVVGVGPEPGTAPSAVSPSPSGLSPGSPTGVADAKARLPVPDDEEQKKSQALFREIFRQDYASAKTAQQKYEFAKRLAEQAKKVKDDPAGRYVLFTAAGKVAAEAGDVTSALEMAEQLSAAFEVDAHEVKFDLLKKAAKQSPYKTSDRDKLILASEELLKQALFNDDYSQAQELLAIAITAATEGNERIKRDELTSRKREVTAARASYAKVEKVVDTLQDDPDDPAANLTVGRYFCFTKHNWKRGLPMLAMGSDDALKRLAREELKQPLDAEGQTQLADLWWELAQQRKKDVDPAARKEMYLRAVYWYLTAAHRLPAGLLQVKAEVRIKDVEKEYGKEAVESLRVAHKGRP